MKYTTTEEIRNAFIKNGWNESTFFEKITPEETEMHRFFVHEYPFYFRMSESGNIYTPDGNIFLYNIPITTHIKAI